MADYTFPVIRTQHPKPKPLSLIHISEPTRH